MAAHQHAAGLNDHLTAAPEDFSQHIDVPALGEADDIHGGFYLTAHGVHIAQGIGSSDLTKEVRILHHRREEVHRLHHGDFIADFINRCVIGTVKADEQIGIRLALGQLAQNMAQDPWAQLCTSAAILTKHDFFIHVENLFLKDIFLRKL